MYNRVERDELAEMERELHKLRVANEVLEKRIKQYQMENEILTNKFQRIENNYFDAMAELYRRKRETIDG